jgi:uncharacterized protein
MKRSHIKKMDPVVDFEMPAEDRKRMADFYTSVFGWQTQMFGEEMGNYVTATTTEVNEKGRPKIPGAINGGFYMKQKNAPLQYPSLVIAVDDILESMRRVTEQGGQVLGEAVEIPMVGLYVSFIDSEGNRNSLLQPKMS